MYNEKEILMIGKTLRKNIKKLQSKYTLNKIFSTQILI